MQAKDITHEEQLPSGYVRYSQDLPAER